MKQKKIFNWIVECGLSGDNVIYYLLLLFLFFIKEPFQWYGNYI